MEGNTTPPLPIANVSKNYNVPKKENIKNCNLPYKSQEWYASSLSLHSFKKRIQVWFSALTQEIQPNGSP